MRDGRLGEMSVQTLRDHQLRNKPREAFGVRRIPPLFLSVPAIALLLGLLWPALAAAVVAPGPDAFGYTVAATTNFSFLQITNGSTRVLWFTDDAAVTNVSIGFPFNFYGASYSNVSFNANGLITFGGATTAYSNVNFTTTSPSPNLPCIAVLWDDWETHSVGSDGVYYKTIGTAPDRQFVVQWNKVIPVNGTGTNAVTFQARLFEGGSRILLSYWQVVVVESNLVASLGAGATVGIRAASGQTNNRDLQWSYNQGAITNGLNLLFAPPASNQPPVINAASISPGTPTRTNSLLAVVTGASDPNGDLINYVYQWQQSTNNTAFNNIAGQISSTLGTAMTQAGSYYRVLITPNDGLSNGPLFTTASVRVALDADANGMNDDWEVRYFGRIGVDPKADPDADGMSNSAEYLAGTNPTNSASLLRIISLTVTGENVAVSWTTVPNKGYIVQTNSTSGGGFVDFSPLIVVSGAGEGMTNYLDLNGRANGMFRFYRVRLAP